MNDDNEEMTHAYFFYTFFAMWALNCYQEIACLPFPAIDWIASWTWSSVKFIFSIAAIFFKLLKVILSSPSLSKIEKACRRPSSLWACPYLVS